MMAEVLSSLAKKQLRDIMLLGFFRPRSCLFVALVRPQLPLSVAGGVRSAKSTRRVQPISIRMSRSHSMRIRFLFILLGLLSLHQAKGQASLSCIATAVPPIVRVEGLSERLGDIVLNCTGGAPGGSLTGNLVVFLNVNVANRITSPGSLDVVLTADSGTGPVPVTTPASLLGLSGVAFNGLNIPLSPSGALVLRITNVRGAIASEDFSIQRPVTARLAFNGGSVANFTFNEFPVGIPVTGLLAGASSLSVVCVGSPLPSTIDLPNLFSRQTRFFSARVTEGTAEAFEPRQPMTDSGVRIMIRYSGFPEGARLFVPDAIAGSSAIQQTAGGDLGVPQAAGTYQLGPAGSLLLVRVQNTDANGAGGTLAYTVDPNASGPVTFSSVGEIALTNGAGAAVFEVVDSNRTVLESAQIPTFLGIGQTTGGNAVVANAKVSLAPLSTIATTSTTAPIPRFTDVPPPLDCTAMSDCNAGYFPELVVDSPPLQFTARAGSAFQVRYIRVLNEGGSVLNWTANVTYANGADWIRIDRPAGLNNATIRLDVLPERLTPGIYEATLTIDAGPFAGTRTARIRLEVTQLPVQPPPPPQVIVQRITNGADFREGPVVPGSITTLFGSRLTGTNVEVTFDGVPARLFYTSEGQINLQVPSEMAGRSTAQVFVTVDGIRSAVQTVQVAAVSPAIFGVLNQDSSLNSANNPALTGSVIQVFATGLTSPGATQVTARIHDRQIETPLYGGPAPGFPAVQQINFAVPSDLPTMSTEVRVCGAPDANPAQRLCGPPLLMYIRR